MLTDGVSMSIPAKMEGKKIFGLANGYEELLLLLQKKNLHRDDGEHLQRRENIENMEGMSNHTYIWK
jgi:hypothetical protein